MLGRNINLTWYQVALEDSDNVCWVWVGVVEFIGDLEDVEIVPLKSWMLRKPPRSVPRLPAAADKRITDVLG